MAVLTAVFPGCSKAPEENTAKQETLDPAAKTEERWLVTSVATDLARLAAFAGGQPMPQSPLKVTRVVSDAGKAPIYEVTLPAAGTAPGRTVQVAVTTHALDAAIYRPLAVGLREMFPPRTGGAASTGAGAQALSAFDTDAFLAENKRVSALLTEQPANAGAQADAAVLLGAFAMRDNAGAFWDPLPACARAAAHLALAQSLGLPADDGRILLGQLCIELIVDTKARAEAQIATLARLAETRPEFRPWVAAARFRNTRDWRPAAGEARVEQVERFRALGDAAGTGPAWDYLESFHPTGPDWGRIMLEMSFTVEDGHRFAPAALSEELTDAGRWLERPVPKNAIEAESFVSALNAPLVPSVETDGSNGNRIEVLDKGLRADFAQRHICHAIYETWRFLADLWGVPDDARGFWTQIEGAFSKLDLFPVITLLRNCPPATVAPYAGRLRGLFADFPERVPDMAWARAQTRFANLFPDARKASLAWFTPPILTGTAYRFGARFNQLPNFQSPSREELAAILAAAPLQQSTVVAYLGTLGRSVDEATLRKVAGPLLEYCLPVIRFAANHAAGDPAVREKLLETGAKINADDADQLARLYLARHEPEKAAAAYQLYVDRASDRVRVANSCDWLVKYYFDHGQQEKAVAIAKMAAEVYSYQGLETYASLLERMADWSGAEENYQKIAERYEDSSPLYLFYKRRQLAGQMLGAKAEEMERRVFPGGLKAAGISDFSDRPRNGVSIDGSNDRTEANGLRPGDVIVAIEGKRVETFEQYLFIRNLSSDPHFRLIIYRDGKYREVAATAEDRRFEVPMTTFK
jgi:hypothetical protein